MNKFLKALASQGKNFHCCRRHFAGEYKSAYSLDRIYGQYKQKETVPTEPSDPQSSEFNGFIPMGVADRLKISYDRSTGPGGQHVNTTNSRAEIRFSVAEADWIPKIVRQKFAQKFAHRITRDGDMIIRSERTRVQSLNLADCLDKLRFSVTECLEEFRAENKELSPEVQATLKKREQKAARIRLVEKRKQSEKRRNRSGVVNL